MKSEKTINKILGVSISNVIKLISGIVVALMIPKILSVSNYGYYKIFILYLAYTGLFNFGFIDGIYLKYGGKDYDSIDKGIFRTFFKYLVTLVLFVSLVIFIIAFTVKESNTRTIFILLAINLLSVHITGYFQIISQITSRFKEFSQRIIISAIGNLIITSIIYVFNFDNFVIYLLLVILLNYAMSIWYIFTYKDIVIGKKSKISYLSKEIIFLTISGIPLLLANLASTFVLNVDKQIVQIFFDVEIFAVYSFAYSMLTMITVVVSAIGVVLYPTLKKTNIDNIGKNYPKLNMIIICVVLIGLLGYFPLQWIIPRFLPNYATALIVFRIALPGLIFTSSITAVKHNFFKITNKNTHFFIIAILIILLNIGLNLGAYYIFGTTIAISISSIIGISIWNCLTEMYLVKMHKTKWIKTSLIIIIGLILFYSITSIDNYVIGGFLYLISIIFIIYVFNADSIQYFFKKSSNPKE